MIDIDVNTILDQEKQQIEHVQKRIKRERERAKSALLSRPHGIIGQPYVALTSPRRHLDVISPSKAGSDNSIVLPDSMARDT